MCEDEVEYSNYLVMDTCITIGNSSSMYACVTGMVSVETYLDNPGCVGENYTSTLPSFCNDSQVISCDGDYFVDRPDVTTTEQPYNISYNRTTSEPISNDPGCKAIDLDGFYQPIDYCLSSNGSSYMYSCEQDGSVTYQLFAQDECLGDSSNEMNNYCDAIGCVSYCSNDDTCSMAGIQEYEGSNCTGQVVNQYFVVLDACSAYSDDNFSTSYTCDGNFVSNNQWSDNLMCMGTISNSTSRPLDTCKSHGNYSELYFCDASMPSTTDMDNTNDDSDTTMDGTGETIAVDTQTTDDDDVDPTVDGSSAFAVSKTIAVILSVVGTVCFV